MPLRLRDEVVQQNGLPDTPEAGQVQSPLGSLAFGPDIRRPNASISASRPSSAGGLRPEPGAKGYMSESTPTVYRKV